MLFCLSFFSQVTTSLNSVKKSLDAPHFFIFCSEEQRIFFKGGLSRSLLVFQSSSSDIRSFFTQLVFIFSGAKLEKCFTV